MKYIKYVLLAIGMLCLLAAGIRLYYDSPFTDALFGWGAGVAMIYGYLALDEVNKRK